MLLFITSIIGFIATMILVKLHNSAREDEKTGWFISFLVSGITSVVFLVLSFLVVIPSGRVGNMTFMGIVQDRILEEGTITHKMPWNSVIHHNIKAINLTENIPARTSDQTKVTVDITIPFELNPLASVAITTQIGANWEPTIQAWLRSSTRDAIANFTWQEVTSTEKDKVSEAVRQEAIKKIASTLVSAGLPLELANNAFTFHDIQLRDVDLPQRLDKALESYAAAEKEKETQKQLTFAAVEEAKRREQEGKGYGNLFEGFPTNMNPSEVAKVLEAMSKKTQADAISQLVDKGMPGDGKVIVVIGNATPMIGTGK